MKKETYLEISGRRTGKSSRLFKAALAWSEFGDSIIVAPNYGMVNQYNMIISKDYDLFHPNKLYTFTSLKNMIDRKREIGGFNNPRYFFDEFCFIDDIDDLEYEMFNGNYFVSTPNKLYTELDLNLSNHMLCRLLKFCKSFNIDIIRKQNLELLQHSDIHPNEYGYFLIS